MLEKGYSSAEATWGGTHTIIRAKYFLRGNSELYSHLLKLWEGLEADLNYNAMVSQRGPSSPLLLRTASGMPSVRRGNAMLAQGR